MFQYNFLYWIHSINPLIVVDVLSVKGHGKWIPRFFIAQLTMPMKNKRYKKRNCLLSIVCLPLITYLSTEEATTNMGVPGAVRSWGIICTPKEALQKQNKVDGM